MWKPLAGTGAVSEKSEITKVEAARRQLDCAIRLFFEDEDSLPIHTLAWAAFEVLFDLYPKHRSDGFSHHLERIIQTPCCTATQQRPSKASSGALVSCTIASPG